jgi:hypothetical protein
MIRFSGKIFRELFRQKVPRTPQKPSWKRRRFSGNFLGKKFPEPFKNLLGKEGFCFFADGLYDLNCLIVSLLTDCIT